LDNNKACFTRVCSLLSGGKSFINTDSIFAIPSLSISKRHFHFPGLFSSSPGLTIDHDINFCITLGGIDRAGPLSELWVRNGYETLLLLGNYG